MVARVAAGGEAAGTVRRAGARAAFGLGLSLSCGRACEEDIFDESCCDCSAFAVDNFSVAARVGALGVCAAIFARRGGGAAVAREEDRARPRWRLASQRLVSMYTCVVF